MATTQGKQGIWFLLFPDREHTGNFAVTQGKYFRHRENLWTVIINTRIMLLFVNFKIFLLAITYNFSNIVKVYLICAYLLIVTVFIQYLSMIMHDYL